MSLINKAILSAASAVLARKVVSIASDLELDDILRPLGLARRRSRFGQTLLLLGAGVAVGGGAALLLTPSTRKELRARVEQFRNRSKTDARQEDRASANDFSNGDTRRDLHIPI